MSDQTDRLAAVLRPALAAIGLECYDVELTGNGRGRTLRVLVDRPRDELANRVDGPHGVDLDAITAATEALGPVLDGDPAVAAALPGAYLLEVSSPGVERPLRTRAHFLGAIGVPVSLKARDASGAAARRRVVVLAADDTGIDVEDDGARERVEYADILQARTVFEWGPGPKPGKARTGAAKSKPTVSARG